jgi:hypothetical protein
LADCSEVITLPSGPTPRSGKRDGADAIIGSGGIDGDVVFSRGEVKVFNARLLGWVMAVALAAASSPLLAEDGFPIVGTYTENTPCAGADASTVRVKITPSDIDSPILGLCTILEKKRENDKISVHVECKGAGGASMLGDITFTMRSDGTLDFADQDNTYKAVLHKCPG